ncbi:MAG: hypothetical protein BHV69_09935 [Bacteroidales bacterium 52_46]|nr:MAG: hypothetical protein BHV69_09935 [Bacteroidales bacterium 52_46]
MDKTTQDLAWSVLPKEFKEEVKKSYRYYSCMAKDQYDCGIVDCIETIFGKHNLTSDTEEEEMLTCERGKVQQLYNEATEIIHKNSKKEGDLFFQMVGMSSLLLSLFGSKCLPDNVDSLKPKPAEPKFKVGDIVRFKYGCTPYRIDGFKMLDGTMLYQVGEVWAAASDLEPYTEPAEPTCTRTCTDDCPSQHKIPCVNLSQETANCDKCNGLRLHIAAMAMQGLLASPVDANMQSKSVDYIVKASFEYADALIAEAEKGGAVGNS